MMKLQYELRAEDVIQYYLHMSRKSRQFNGVVKKRQIRLFVLLFLLAIVYSFIWPVSNFLFYIAGSAMISFVAAYLYSFYIFNRIGRRLRRFHSKGTKKSLYGYKTIEISEQGVSDQTDETLAVQYKWDSIKQVYITSLYIFIHVNDFSAIMIPRRAFSDRHAWDEFKSALNSYQAQGRGLE